MNYLKNVMKEFKEFAIKGDAMTLAVGVVIGTAFKGVIDSLVKDIILPPINYVTANIDFTNLFLTIGRTKYATLAQAEAANALVIKYGNFINEMIIFLLTALAVFIFIYKFQQFVTKKEKQEKKAKPTRKCPYCFQEIPTKASKCAFCTSAVKPTFKDKE